MPWSCAKRAEAKTLPLRPRRKRKIAKTLPSTPRKKPVSHWAVAEGIEKHARERKARFGRLRTPTRRKKK